MDFFSKLVALGNVDISMRIMQKNDKLTIEWMPGSARASGVKPMLTTGTGEELDASFFDRILPKVNEIKGLQDNLDEVKAETETVVKENAEKPAAKKPAAPVKKFAPKKAATKPPVKKAATKKPAAPPPAAAEPKRLSEEIMEEAEAIENEVVAPATPPPAKKEADPQPDLFSSGLLQ